MSRTTETTEISGGWSETTTNPPRTKTVPTTKIYQAVLWVKFGAWVRVVPSGWIHKTTITTTNNNNEQPMATATRQQAKNNH